MAESLIEVSAYAHEPTQPMRAHWATPNGTVIVTVIAYSIGATLAFCIVGLTATDLTAGNYACCWVPTWQLIFL